MVHIVPHAKIAIRMPDDTLAEAHDALRQVRLAAARDPHAASADLLDALKQLETCITRLAETQCNLVRQERLIDERLLKVERNRMFRLFGSVMSTGADLLRRIEFMLPEHMRRADPYPRAYARWVNHEQASSIALDEARVLSAAWPQRPKITLLMCVVSGEWLKESLASLQKQAYCNWELCLAVSPALASRVSALSGPLCSVVSSNSDPAGMLNAAASLATGEYLSFLDESGTLAPLALYHVAETLRSSALDVVYTDEDAVDKQGRRSHPVFKPDWSPDLLTSCMYMGRLLTIRRGCFQSAGGLSSGYGASYLFDLVLRLSDAPLRVAHIPRVLYHSLSSPSIAPSKDVARAISAAIERREGLACECIPGAASGFFIVRRNRRLQAMTAIICSRSPRLLKPCVQSLRKTASNVIQEIVVVAHEEFGPDSALSSVIREAGALRISYGGEFNFSVMNNLGAAAATTSNLIFLNDDLRATAAGWSEMIAEHLSSEEIGAVGSVLSYPSGALQHAGIITGIGDGVGHAGRFMQSSKLWPWLFAVRNVSAVTGACLAIRKKAFEELRGFNPAYPNNYNDVDLCFRLRCKGYRILCVPATGLIHAECQSRAGFVSYEERFRFYQDWKPLLTLPDPYYSPSLAPTEKIALNLNRQTTGSPVSG